MLGSAWFVGRIGDERQDNTNATDGLRFADEVETNGWRGNATAMDLPMDAFYELHLEQGPVLEEYGADIGIVTSVQGLRWLDVRVTGADAPAGMTPFSARRDALLAAAAMLVGVNEAGQAEGHDARVSFGRLQTATDGPSTVVGWAESVIDIRHPDATVLRRLDTDCRQTCEELARRYGFKVEVSERFAILPTIFDQRSINALEAAAQALQLPYRKMASDALHDADNVATLVPSAVVFVPCRGGVSHNVAEYASKEHLATGCNVLLRAMLSRAN